MVANENSFSSLRLVFPIIDFFSPLLAFSSSLSHHMKSKLNFMVYIEVKFISIAFVSID